MLTELCSYLRNWFVVDESDKHVNTFKIEGGALDTSSFDILEDQYFRIIGSHFNDGVHKYPTINLKDETFRGAIWVMCVPQEVLDLNDEIDDWITKNNDIGKFESESFGGYTYKLRSSSTGGVYTWRDAFMSRLKKWRKLK